jgi:F-type H+-transporting ATPase subunit b
LRGQKTASQIIEKANAEAQKMIDEARAAAKALQEREAQAAVAQASQIIAKAREARKSNVSSLHRTQTRSHATRYRHDLEGHRQGLTAEDQRRLSEEAKRELAA